MASTVERARRKLRVEAVFQKDILSFVRIYYLNNKTLWVLRVKYIELIAVVCGRVLRAIASRSRQDLFCIHPLVYISFFASTL